ncbi:hypothetical protein [Lactiplantibacillus carotarum]|nr:hypothetical protein [Lactiplantibacillus carotarum]
MVGEKPLPHVWTINDFEELEDARRMGHLFSRKFDISIDKK